MKYFKITYLGLIFLFLYLPIFIIIFFSFNSTSSTSNFESFSLIWYKELFTDREILEALWVTLKVGVISSLIATIIGTLASFGIHKMGKFSKRTVLAVNNIPVVNPDIVTGISLMIFFVTAHSFLGRFFLQSNSALSFNTLLMAHIIFSIPYVIITVLPKLKTLNESLYEAAIDLGAKPIYAFVKVVIPEIFSSILGGMLIAFTMSIDDFLISYFTAGNIDTLSTKIYAMTKRRIEPSINALATLMFVLVLTVLIIIYYREKSKKEGNRSNEKQKK